MPRAIDFVHYGAIISDLIGANSSVNLLTNNHSSALMSAISDGSEVREDYLWILQLKKPGEPEKEVTVLDKIVSAAAERSFSEGRGALLTEDMAIEMAPGILKKNSTELTALLLKAGADVNVVNSDGETPFFLAVTYGRPAAMLKMLTDAGVDVNKANNEGTTPFMLAAAGQDPELVLALSFPGLDMNKTDHDGLTALQIAAGSGSPKVISALKQRGAEIDFLPPNDISALMLATKLDKKENVNALLAEGAQVNLKNKAGHTAIGFSRKGDVRQLLIDNHAEVNGQEAMMAQSDLQYCVDEFLDFVHFSAVGRSISGSGPDYLGQRDTCEGFGNLSMFMNKFEFKQTESQYMGKTIQCTVESYDAKCQ